MDTRLPFNLDSTPATEQAPHAPTTDAKASKPRPSISPKSNAATTSQRATPFSPPALIAEFHANTATTNSTTSRHLRIKITWLTPIADRPKQKRSRQRTSPRKRRQSRTAIAFALALLTMSAVTAAEKAPALPDINLTNTTQIIIMR